MRPSLSGRSAPLSGRSAPLSGRSAADENDAKPQQSVYEQILGPQIELLHPQLRRYFGPIPAGHEGRGSGVYSWAGGRRSMLRPVLAWLAFRHVLFPERGRNVPFAIRNRPEGDGALSARREFTFPRVTRVMEDTMRVVPGAGGKPRLVDRLGRRRGLEVELEVRVHEGALRMRSTRLWLRMRVPVAPRSLWPARAKIAPLEDVAGADVPARDVPAVVARAAAVPAGSVNSRSIVRRGAVLRVPLPGVVTMTLDERAHPDGSGRQCVDVRLRSPIIGDVFRYVGEFEYSVVPASEPDTTGGFSGANA
ncbi:DUF4166 domain-containing protein [Pseudoclavibacter sp. RFBA6]|uniref:DUF4166 domain-containing protein n=1 Tax=Pseudoclavibacter sp. RFBA6 TaxID=2080573 RepID=UPI000CE8A6D6|nr:DUF4166 domain-containing protein [Pseudoclavibacter sp. RFBA6]PPG40542.1 hypothetical protein C5C17_06985 [Pseudoclavibacter sp. RFBA6]